MTSIETYEELYPELITDIKVLDSDKLSITMSFMYDGREYGKDIIFLYVENIQSLCKQIREFQESVYKEMRDVFNLDYE